MLSEKEKVNVQRVEQPLRKKKMNGARVAQSTCLKILQNIAGRTKLSAQRDGRLLLVVTNKELARACAGETSTGKCSDI